MSVHRTYTLNPTALKVEEVKNENNGFYFPNYVTHTVFDFMYGIGQLKTKVNLSIFVFIVFSMKKDVSCNKIKNITNRDKCYIQSDNTIAKMLIQKAINNVLYG